MSGVDKSTRKKRNSLRLTLSKTPRPITYSTNAKTTKMYITHLFLASVLGAMAHPAAESGQGFSRNEARGLLDRRYDGEYCGTDSKIDPLCYVSDKNHTNTTFRPW